jgi:hypothetical protein
LQVREIEPADSLRHVAERVTAAIAVASRLRGLTDPHSIQHDEREPAGERHGPT